MNRVRVAAVAAATLIGLLLPAAALSRQPARTTVRGPGRYLVLVVMDGFRPDYVTQAPMHHLHMLMRSGMSYTRGWVGQLETETPTGHATIATGVYPRKHGVIGFVWRDQTGQNITWMPTDLRLLNAGDMENLIEADGVPTLSDLLHRKYHRAISVALSGEKFYAVDAMGPGADYLVYGDSFYQNQGWIIPTAIGRHIPPPSTHLKSLTLKAGADPLTEDQWAGRLAVRMVNTVHPRMLLLNLPGSDIEGHRSGGVTNPLGIHNVDMGIDRVLGELINLYKREGIYNRTDFVITADHGMIPNGHEIPRKAMYAAVRATGADTLEQDLTSTGGYLYLRDPSQAERVADAMAARHFKHVEGAFYKVPTASGYEFKAAPSTAKDLGPSLTRAYIDLCNTFASKAGPDVVLPYAEDTLGYLVGNYGPHWGTHGGLSWRVQHIPLVISGPGVRHGVSSFPAKLVDIAPTVERLMGFPIPSGVDGVVLGDALTHPGPHDLSAQRAVLSRRSQDVTALLKRSREQHALTMGPQ